MNVQKITPWLAGLVGRTGGGHSLPIVGLAFAFIGRRHERISKDDSAPAQPPLTMPVVPLTMAIIGYFLNAGT